MNLKDFAILTHAHKLNLGDFAIAKFKAANKISKYLSVSPAG